MSEYDYTQDIGKTVLVRQEDLFLQGKLDGVVDDPQQWLVIERNGVYYDVQVTEDQTYRVVEPSFADKLDALPEGAVLGFGMGQNKTTYIKYDGTWHTLGFGVRSTMFSPDVTTIIDRTEEAKDA